MNAVQFMRSHLKCIYDQRFRFFISFVFSLTLPFEAISRYSVRIDRAKEDCLRVERFWFNATNFLPCNGRATVCWNQW